MKVALVQSDKVVHKSWQNFYFWVIYSVGLQLKWKHCVGTGNTDYEAVLMKGFVGSIHHSIHKNKAESVGMATGLKESLDLQ